MSVFVAVFVCVLFVSLLFSLSLKLVVDLFYLHYIPPTPRHEHAVHGALLAHCKWTVMIIVMSFQV